MSRIVRAALTETCNAYQGMPIHVADVPSLADKLDDIRTANLEHHVELIQSASTLGVQILCMGELFAAPYFALETQPMWLAMAEDATTGPTVTRMREVARQQQMILIAPIYELDSASGKRFNTAVVIDEAGEVLGKYRKCHIPEGENDAGSFHETFYYERSDGQLGDSTANVADNPYFPVFATSLGRVGVSICYDRHFPGVARSLAAGGAELVFSPAVTFGQKSEVMWHMEFCVDAARHHMFIGGSNRLGSEAPWHQEYFGGSHFVGPNGRLENLAPSGSQLVVAELNLGELSAADPSGWDFGRDTRPEFYSK